MYMVMVKDHYVSNKAKLEEGVIIGNLAKILGPAKIGEKTFIDDLVIIGAMPFSLGAPSIAERLIANPDLTIDDVTEKETAIGPRGRIMRYTIISAGAYIGENFQCEPSSFIGEDTKIGNNVSLTYKAQIYDKVQIGDNCWIGGFVGERSIIGKNVTMLGSLIHKYNFNKEKRPVLNEAEPAPIIKDYAAVGFGAIIIGGVRIGEGAYVAAESVVTKDVEANDLVAGNPAISIKHKTVCA